jgi:hypothetical protein
MKSLGHLYFLLGLGAFALLAFLYSLYKSLAHRYRMPYEADPVLFSPAQIVFLRALERAVGPGYRVFGRVRAVDIVAPRRRLDRRTRRRAWERLGGRRFDFLVCQAKTSAIACAVNLAPRSRLRRAPPRDALDRICAAAGLPFVRFRESDGYSVTEIEGRVLAAIQAAGTGLREAEPARSGPADDPGELPDLREAIVAEDRRSGAGRGRPSIRRPARGVQAGSAPAQSANTGANAEAAPARPALVAPPIEPPRLEPTLTSAGDIDLGPSFRIDGDLDEDEPRARRRRV